MGYFYLWLTGALFGVFLVCPLLYGRYGKFRDFGGKPNSTLIVLASFFWPVTFIIAPSIWIFNYSAEVFSSKSKLQNLNNVELIQNFKIKEKNQKKNIYRIK